MKIHMENPGKVKSRHGLVRDMQGRDPKSIAESMVQYYMEGGSVDNILNILEGNEASVGSVRDYADDICLKLEDGGVPLTESRVDVDSQQVEIVLDRPSQEMLQECVNRIGKDVGVSQKGDRVTLTVQYDGEMTSPLGNAPHKMVEGVRRSVRVGSKPISNKLAESIARNAKSMSAHRLAATFGISYADAIAVKGLNESRNSKKEIRWIPCSNCSSVMDLTESKTHRCRSCGNEQMFTERELRRIRRETMGSGNCRYCGEYLKESRDILSCPQCGWTRLSETAETKQLNETTLAMQATAGGEMAMQQKDPYEQAPELIPAGCHCGSTLHKEGQGKEAEYVCLGMDEEDGQASQHRFPVDQIFKPAGAEATAEEPKQESTYVLKPKATNKATIYKMRSGVNVVVEAKDEYSGLTGCHDEGIGDNKEDAGMITYSQKPGPTAEKDVGKKESLYEFAVMMRDSSIASQKEAVSRLRESGLLKGGVSVWHKTESGWDPLAEGVEPCGQILITAKNENIAQNVTEFLGREGKKTEMGRMNPFMASKTKTEKEGENGEGEGKKKGTDPEIVYPSLKNKDGEEEEPEAEPERSPEDIYPSLKGKGDEEGGEEAPEPEPEMEPTDDEEGGGEDVYDYEEPSGDEEGGEEPEQEYEEPEDDEEEGDEDEKEEGARFPAFAGGEEDQYQGTAKDKQMPSSTYQPGSIGANRAGMPVSNTYSIGKPDPKAPNAGGMTGDDDQLPGPGPGTGVDPWAKAWGNTGKKESRRDPDPTFSFSENVSTMLKDHLLSEGLDINGINQNLTESGLPRVNQQQLNALHHLRGQGKSYAEMRQKTGLPEEAIKIIIEGKEAPQIPNQ